VALEADAEIEALFEAEIEALFEAEIEALFEAEIEALFEAEIEALFEAEIEALFEAEIEALFEAEMDALFEAEIEALFEAEMDTLSETDTEGETVAPMTACAFENSDVFPAGLVAVKVIVLVVAHTPAGTMIAKGVGVTVTRTEEEPRKICPSPAGAEFVQ